LQFLRDEIVTRFAFEDCERGAGAVYAPAGGAHRLRGVVAVASRNHGEIREPTIVGNAVFVRYAGVGLAVPPVSAAASKGCDTEASLRCRRQNARGRHLHAQLACRGGGTRSALSCAHSLVLAQVRNNSRHVEDVAVLPPTSSREHPCALRATTATSDPLQVERLLACARKVPYPIVTPVRQLPARISRTVVDLHTNGRGVAIRVPHLESRAAIATVELVQFLDNMVARMRHFLVQRDVEPWWTTRLKIALVDLDADRNFCRVRAAVWGQDHLPRPPRATDALVPADFVHAPVAVEGGKHRAGVVRAFAVVDVHAHVLTLARRRVLPVSVDICGVPLSEFVAVRAVAARVAVLDVGADTVRTGKREAVRGPGAGAVIERALVDIDARVPSQVVVRNLMFVSGSADAFVRVHLVDASV